MILDSFSPDWEIPIDSRSSPLCLILVHRFELELLFRLTGFARWEVFGGFAREPLERADQQMIAWAWKA